MVVAGQEVDPSYQVRTARGASGLTFGGFISVQLHACEESVLHSFHKTRRRTFEQDHVSLDALLRPGIAADSRDSTCIQTLLFVWDDCSSKMVLAARS